MTIPQDPDPEIRQPGEPDRETDVPDSDVPDEVPERQNPDYRAPSDDVADSPMRMPGDNPDVETEI